MRTRIEGAYKFQYFFGGKTVAYADGKHGREVIALDEQIPGALARLSPKERNTVAIAFPSPWPTEAAESVTPFFDEAEDKTQPM